MEDTHEAIIDKETFFEVQNLRKEKGNIQREKYNLYTKTETADNKYKGLLICKHCGRLLKMRYRNISNEYYFFCRGEDCLFESKVHCKIRESEIDKILFHTVKESIGSLSPKDDWKNKLEYFYKCQLKDMENKLKKLQGKKEHKLSELQRKYEEYVKGELLLENYQKKKLIFKGKFVLLKKKVGYILKSKKQQNKKEESLNVLSTVCLI